MWGFKPETVVDIDIAVTDDSHTRHITGRVGVKTRSTLSVGGMNSRTKPNEYDQRSEVLIASTNDLAVGEKQNIRRHLES
ncbi:hypothetical protein J6590_065701 [Homalodisca vitripennis]|nr:hypothetical protein J6590_065692 [Homalodisca vitripennis]KAG8276426.1 hypothetical protein J6590_065701 [Homalodisca vitripennis]